MFWDTGSAEDMNDMFLNNADFKGYVGTWDVSGVEWMGGMFNRAGIEDSGIANWNTIRVTNASHMFYMAPSLSESLKLSGWVFGREPDLDSMFADSSIVDCGIGDWKVKDADVSGMLFGANRFTGNLEKWPTQKVRDAEVPVLPPGVRGGAGFGSAAFADTESQIADVFARALRSSEKGAQGVSTNSNSKEQCAIL